MSRGLGDVYKRQIITYVILMVIQLVVTLNPNGALDNAMQESYLAKTMSTYNILNVFFKT